jgi:hypothetical protein
MRKDHFALAAIPTQTAGACLPPDRLSILDKPSTSPASFMRTITDRR